MAGKDVLDGAIAAHGAWRTRLRQAIASGKTDFDIAKVKQDNQCAFGKWLYEELPAADRNSPRYARVRQLHATFHVEAAKILELAVRGQKAEAEAAMAMRTPFAGASAALTAELTAWRDSLPVMA